MTWQELFDSGDHIRLALWVREQGGYKPGASVQALADDQIRLYGGAREAARLSKRGETLDPENPDSLIVTPMADDTPEAFDKLIAEAKDQHPDVEVAGFGPTGWNGELDRQIVLVGKATDSFEEENGWSDELHTQSRKTLVFVYSPEVRARALEEAVKCCTSIAGVETVVPLPLGAGDRIPLPGLTTAGSEDMCVLSALRHLLPKEIKVRVSWAALGWKVAQMGLVYGADEMAGWSGAETKVYTGRVRAAARVESDEVDCGIAEAGCVRIPWGRRTAEVAS